MLQSIKITMGGANKVEIPDYKTQTVGAHTPELKDLQERLARRGLKDPWLRNEVWRYDNRVATKRQAVMKLIRPKMALVGLGVALVTNAAQRYFDKRWEDQYGHLYSDHH